MWVQKNSLYKEAPLAAKHQQKGIMKLLLLPAVLALNILISTTDSWVSKSPRYLEWALRERGHSVKVVASLNPNTEVPPVEHELHRDTLEDFGDGVAAGGDFNHLLPAHQTYLKNVRRVNVARGAKNTILKRDLDALESEFSSQAVQNELYGQDPLNRNFWYVDGTPLEALSLAFDEILPSHAPDFAPDLVIVGPNEGLHLTPPNSDDDVVVEDLDNMDDKAHALALLAQLHKVPVITVSSEDHDRVYYNDDRYFNVEVAQYKDAFKANPIAKNVQFVNDRIVHLIEKVVGSSLDASLSLNINFPSMNHKYSNCFATSHHGPKFAQVTAAKPKFRMGKIVSVPRADLRKRAQDSETRAYFKLSEDSDRMERLSEIELRRMSAIVSKPGHEFEKNDLHSYYSNKHELSALQRCQIAVSVNHVTKGNNLGTDVFRVPH
ncbi:hypothetical protein ACI3LY_002846 [Candidozyma auris]|uniref:5'/3'-nucleotidase SurE n=2 Tax=Candidozyma auris TaxID=498019 RepID=A0A2H0ZMT4_CANAR|nr:hypothetical protein QG37_07613 [[Candida] auris]PIS51934.1 5'/3'-nucleotidase SurE [[Candida] auris]QWW21744.1 hypothetical protein CA7LBN_000490 [[Candida] auris]